MKLKVENVVNNLKALELGEVHLFSEYNKSISLMIKEDSAPQLAVRLKKDVHYFSLNERDKAQELFDKAFVIKDDDNANLIDFIKTCEAGIRYKFPDGIRAIEIDIEHDGTFCWTYSNGIWNSYPMKNANCVKTFKTDMGARRSLIKYLDLEKK